MSAVDAELQAVQEEGGNQVPLFDRQEVRPEPFGNYYYQFRADGEVGLPDESPISVKVGTESVPGVIVSVSGFRVLLSLTDKLCYSA